MIDLSWAELSGRHISNATVCLTIGVFDGVHRGHRDLIRRVADCPDAVASVVTFDRHPDETLRPEEFDGYLMTPRQKRAMLEDLGIRLVVGIDFSHEFSTMSGTDFLERLLRSFSVRRIVVGHDFTCGNQMELTADGMRDMLEPRGVEVQVVDPVVEDGSPLSSSRIRRLIRGGELENAERLLSAPYEIDACDAFRRIVLERRQTGMVTSCGQLVPPQGVYAGYTRSGNSTQPCEISVNAASLEWDCPVGGGQQYIGMKEQTE